jgi:hypothetical protein
MNLFHSYFKNEGAFSQINLSPVGELQLLIEKGILKLSKQGNQISGYVELPSYLNSIYDYLDAEYYYCVVYPTNPEILGKTVFEHHSNSQIAYYTNLKEGQQSIAVKSKTFKQSIPDGSGVVQVRDLNGNVVREVKASNRAEVHIDLRSSYDGIYELWIDNLLQEQFFLSSQELDTALAIIQLSVKELKENNTLEVKFNSIEALWNYKIAIKSNITIAEDQVEIRDFQEVSFEAPIKTQFSSNLIAYEINSTSPITLQEEFEESPRLKLGYSDQYSVQTKHMEVKLPNPSSTHLKRFETGAHKGKFFLSKIVYI